MAAAVQIKGLEELNQKLTKLSPETKKMLKVVNKAAALVVSNEAKTIVPVLTGTLMKSIRPGATLVGGVVRAGKGAVPYAGVIHFGSARRRIRPQPFLYEALDNRRAEVLLSYEKGVEGVLNSVGV